MNACRLRLPAYDPNALGILIDAERVPAVRGAGGLPRGDGSGGVSEAAAKRAKRYREQAEHIRLAAREVKDAETRAALLSLVESYERLAAKVESGRDPEQ